MAIRRLAQERDFLIKGLATRWTVAGLDAIESLSLRKLSGLGYFAQQMEMIRHQSIGQDPHAAKGLQPSHQ